jgi:hypothetical protein
VNLKSSCLVAAAVCVSGLLSADAFAQGKRVKDEIRVRPSGNKIEYAVDKRDFHALEKNQLFLTTDPIHIRVEKVNPLSLLVTASASEVDDPRAAVMAKLIEALLGLPVLERPGTNAEKNQTKEMLVGLAARGMVAADAPKTVLDQCKGELGAAIDDILDLDAELYHADWSAKKIKGNLKTWSGNIDKGLNGSTPGYSVISDAVDAISQVIGTDDDSGKDTLLVKLRSAESKLKTIKDFVAAEQKDRCDQAKRTAYRIYLATNPDTRLDSLKKIYKALNDLRILLAQDYGDRTRWGGVKEQDYAILKSVKASRDKMLVVKVAFVRLDYDKIKEGEPPVPATSDIATESFTLQSYSLFIPEIGVGPTFASIERPTYGTGTDAQGRTVVVQTTKKSRLEPTVMVNFVLRNPWAELFVPMLQFGASTSKETPAIFGGAGLRFLKTSKGEFAFGTGWVWWFGQDLNNLQPNAPITGMADIQKDLSMQYLGRKFGYINVQYKF